MKSDSVNRRFSLTPEYFDVTFCIFILFMSKVYNNRKGSVYLKINEPKIFTKHLIMIFQQNRVVNKLHNNKNRTTIIT